jgi:hypothetical protein
MSLPQIEKCIALNRHKFALMKSRSVLMKMVAGYRSAGIGKPTGGQKSNHSAIFPFGGQSNPDSLMNRPKSFKRSNNKGAGFFDNFKASISA